LKGPGLARHSVFVSLVIAELRLGFYDGLAGEKLHGLSGGVEGRVPNIPSCVKSWKR